MYGSLDISSLANLTVPASESDSGYGYDIPTAGLKVSRYPRLFQPIDQTYAFPVGNGIVRTRLPNDGAYDFRRSMFLVDLTVSVTPAGVGPYLAFMNGAWNVFDRFRLLQQGNVIQERNDYAKCYNLVFLLQSDPTFISQIGPLLGIDILANRITNAATTSTYSIPIDTGILVSGIVPMNVLNGAIDTEFYMSRPSDCLDTNGTNGQITLSNIQWFVERVAGAEYESRLMAMWQSGIRIAFKEWLLFQNPILQVAQDLKIGIRRASVDYILSYFTNNDMLMNTDVVTTGFPNRQWNWQKLNLLNYQFRINGMVFPDQAVDCTNNALRAYHMLLNLTNSWELDGLSYDTPNISLDAFNGTDSTHGQFLTIGDFRSNPAIEYGKQNVVNLFGTQAASQDPQLNVRLGTTPPTSTTMFHFARYTVIATVKRDGSIYSEF